jgi:hypothetical protein
VTINQIEQMLDLAKKSNLHSLVYGSEGIGKTSFCKQKYPNALVILANELNDNNLLFLKSAFDVNDVIILENITLESLNFLLPILNNRTIMGTKLKTFFILTARENIEIPNSLPIPFVGTSSLAWTEWAMENSISSVIIEAFKHKDLLETHRPRDLEALSSLLNNKIPNDLLDPILQSFLKNDIQTIDFIKNSLLQGQPAPTIKSNGDKLGRFDIQGVFNNSKVNKRDNDSDTLEHLKILIDEEQSLKELNSLLEDKNIRKIIDDKLRKVI